MPETSIQQTVPGDSNIFTATGDINIVYPLPPAEHEDRRNLLILLDKVRQDWIKDVLEKSIYHEALIQLGKESRPEMVEHPWGRRVEFPDRESRLLPQDRKIVEVFDEAGRALLILGEPGSGKTFSMLELARELIARTENDPMQSIPVVFNLSTWTSQNPSIFDWLVNELKTKYGFSKRFSLPWLEKGRLLLLLDGLDEVALEDRVNCVTAINEFFDEYGLPGLIVCCRLQEYLALPKHLKLRGAICLQPLTSSQIENYLFEAGPKLASLHTVYNEDAVLQELAETPLMLSVMSLAYQDLPIEAIKSPELDTPEKRRKKLFDNYIKRMFVRKSEEIEQDNPPYANNQVTEWLTRLATGMILHSKTIFLMEELQPSWLTTQRQIWVYGLGSQYLFWLIFGLISWLIFGLETALVCWVASQLTYRVKGTNVIKTTEALNWSWAGVRKVTTYALISGLISGLIFKLIFGLSIGLIVGLNSVLILFLISGLSGSSFEKKSFPNQGIYWSIRNALLVWLIFGLIFGLISWLIFGLIPELIFGLFIGLTSGLFFGFAIYGGKDVIKHYTLRLILWWYGYAPLNYARFLDYATKLIFLRKVGGGYIFIHRMLLEHFAAMGKEESDTKVS